jgi:hypothetical protein
MCVENIKIDIENILRWCCGLDLSDSGYGLVKDSCCCCSETPSFIKCGEISE